MVDVRLSLVNRCLHHGTTAAVIPSGPLRKEGGSPEVKHVFWHFHGTIGDVIASRWVPESRVGCMGFHMFLVPPWHSWCRYGAGSLWVP